MSNDRFVDVVYCDDIRHEVGNKLTLVGCYGSDLVVNRMPSTLPKLCVYARFFTPIDRPFGKLTIRVCMGESVLAEMQMPKEAQSAQGSEHHDSRWIVMNAALTLSPFFVEKESKVRVEAETETENGTIVGPQLRIKVIAAQSREPPNAIGRSRRKSAGKH